MRRSFSLSLNLLPLSLLLLACGEPSDATTETSSTPGTGTETSADTSDTSSTTGDPGTTDESTSTSLPGTTDEPTTGTNSTATATTTTTDGTTSSSTGDETGVVEELPPTESAELLEAWLAGGAYKQWAVESQVHASTGPHGGNVRTYVNAIALASLMAKNPEHPKDAATVKELYGGGDTIIGYAVSLKTAPTSNGGATWYWYERIDNTVYADDLGVGLCTGCHGGGADYILTPYPLQ